jgi:hypothetical protein
LKHKEEIKEYHKIYEAKNSAMIREKRKNIMKNIWRRTKKSAMIIT